MNEFEREDRYVVLKIKDINNYLTHLEKQFLYLLSEKIDLSRLNEHKNIMSCVCVESDCGIYEDTWKLVEKEFNKQLNGEKS